MFKRHAMNALIVVALAIAVGIGACNQKAAPLTKRAVCFNGGQKVVDITTDEDDCVPSGECVKSYPRECVHVELPAVGSSPAPTDITSTITPMPIGTTSPSTPSTSPTRATTGLRGPRK
jgi:hypothetical protein